MNESALTLKIKKALQAEGCYCEKIHGGPTQASGIPDLIGVANTDDVRGLFFGLEVKLPGKEKTLTKIQARTLSKIAAAGGCAAVVTTVEGALQAVFAGEGLYGEEA